MIVNTSQGFVNSSPPGVPVIEDEFELTQRFQRIDSLKDDTSALEPQLDLSTRGIADFTHFLTLDYHFRNINAIGRRVPEPSERFGRNPKS